MTTESRLDWRPVTRSLLWHLAKARLHPLAVNDGMGWLMLDPYPDEAERIEAAIEAINGLDECRLACQWGGSSPSIDGRLPRCTFFLVYGNSPEELVADYSWSQRTPILEAVIIEALSAFEEAWLGKACPVSSRGVA